MRPTPIVAAVGIVSAVVIAGVAGSIGSGDNRRTATSSLAASTSSAVVPNTEPPDPSPPPSTPSTEPPADPTVIAGVADAERTTLTNPIGRGMNGPEVTRLQERLLELKFNPGPIDGHYGDYTIQAFWAFQKLVMGVPRDEVTDVVTNEIWQRLQDALDVQPYRKMSEGRATRNHTEVYLPSQVVVFFQDDEPALIAHISSGTEQMWTDVVTIDPGEPFNEDGDTPTDVGLRALAHTPGGVFTYERFIEGRRQSVLGGLYNPAYFNFGIAIHGAQNVPKYPASHGCIRINMYLGELFWDYVAKGDQVFVWNQDGDQPEAAPNDYPWNEIDPDWAASTTTTVATTTPRTSTAIAATSPTAAADPAHTHPPPTTPAPTTSSTTTVPTPTVTDHTLPSS